MCWPGNQLDPVDASGNESVMENEENSGTVDTTPLLIPPNVDREDPRGMREWRLRCRQRALRFARHVLREASEVVLSAQAHVSVGYSIDRAAVNADRAIARLQRELRRMRSPRVYQWVSWLRRSEVPQILHGEARTLAEAKEGALRSLQHIEGNGFYARYSHHDGVALVTGPSGARHELRRAYGKKGKYRGFRWRNRGRGDPTMLV
jgi:hypothetical protein